MYSWALNRRLIDCLPYETEDRRIHGIPHDLAHVTGGTDTVKRSTLLLDEWDEEPAFLTAGQLKLARPAIRSTSQRLLWDLMARVGLRSCEARTFPEAYVFNPAGRRDLKPGTIIPVRLKPRDMEIKFDKPRTVHVPFSLMEEMHAYRIFERRRLAKPGVELSALLLTTCGNAYSKSSAWKVMSDLGKRIGFRIAPLMLRHSYAIHTLLRLREHPGLKLDPLMYVRDRLGHESVQTTMIYLAQIERLLSEEVLAVLGEFDDLYGSGAAVVASAVRAASAREHLKRLT
jgi:integrase